MRSLILALGLLVAMPLAAAANDLGPREAYARAAEDGLLIVDIRQPDEWRETGVVPGAERISLRHPQGEAGLLAAFEALRAQEPERPIALICRTGNRSARLLSHLESHGFTQIYNVREGMLGGDDGPGWIARDLPVEPCRAC
ncbi:hypothetical protein CAI21_04855 [Alkalilimnicola ehrlichii]|uniref:Rhodanese domain-containing protein n=1 Tax=Alkalilimnicola ehrlichii TaxID=351052 RepID=A0A3E0X2A9_9GAMM|nr:rhodanese-like domain-containing protein [Alkalilimnicola ehrlichii]RFA30841.1 hypothetical protein CAI21_04855 [Alkalilimnicola ehrlichii]RFA38421.1 hypothetical protein CAL65_06225 [Alkalilimnicola ehrlichii]